MSTFRAPLRDRLLRRRAIDPETGCWNWLGHIHYTGYGQIRLPGRAGCVESTHRAAYMEFVGPIPDGLHLDHLCRNTRCFNPEHLEPVTPAENARRAETCLTTVNINKTECIRGHEFTEENTYRYVKANGKPYRVCKTCHADAARRYAERRRGGPALPKVTCKSGHSLVDDANVRIINGARICIACDKRRGEAYRLRRDMRFAHSVRAVRAWAVEQGFDISDRGPIPKNIRELYEAAHPMDVAA